MYLLVGTNYKYLKLNFYFKFMNKNKKILNKRKQHLLEMAKAKDRTIDKKIWATMSSQCSRTYKATLGEFARVPGNTSTDVLLQKYIAGIIIFKCPCPTSPEEIDAIKAYKNYGQELVTRGVSFDTILRLYNENAPDSLIGTSASNLTVNSNEDDLEQAANKENILSDTELDDIAVEIQDLKNDNDVDVDKLDDIEDKLGLDDEEEENVTDSNVNPLKEIVNVLNDNKIDYDIVSLTEPEMAYAPNNILWKNYQRGMSNIQNVLGIDESVKFIHFSLDNIDIRNNMQSFNIRLTRLFRGNPNNVLNEIFGIDNVYGTNDARLVLKREFFVGPRTVQESIKNLVYKLGTKNIIIQYNGKDLMDRGSQTFTYDKVTFYIQNN